MAIPRKKQRQGTPRMLEVPCAGSSPQVCIFNLTRFATLEKLNIQTVVQFNWGQSKRQKNADVNFTLTTEEDLSLLLVPAQYVDKINDQGLEVSLTSDDECERTCAAFIQALRKRIEEQDDEPPF